MESSDPNQEKATSAGESPVVRTLKTDLSKIAEDTTGATVHDIIEKDRLQKELKKSQSLSSFKNQFFLVFGILLVLGALLALGVTLWRTNQKVETIITVPVFLFTENTDVFTTDATTSIRFAEQFKSQILDTPQEKDTIHGIEIRDSFDNEVLTVERILSLMQGGLTPRHEAISAIRIGTTTFGSDVRMPYMLVYIEDEDALGVMRAWEETLITETYFFLNIQPSSFGTDIFTEEFKTKLIQNREVRVMEDSTGKVILLYGALRGDVFAITTNLESYTEIFRRTDQNR